MHRPAHHTAIPMPATSGGAAATTRGAISPQLHLAAAAGHHRQRRRKGLLWVLCIALCVAGPAVLMMATLVSQEAASSGLQGPPRPAVPRHSTALNATLTRPTRDPSAPRWMQRHAGHTQRSASGDESRPDPSALAALGSSDGLSQDKLSLVLCTWSGDAEGYPRIPLLLSSVQKFLDAGSILEFVFIMPEGDLPLFERRRRDGFGLPAGRRPEFSVRFVSDEEVLGLSKEGARALTPRGELHENGGRGANYRRQMLLKLGVAKVLRTEFYITLDSDVFLKRGAAYGDLVNSGRALVQGHERDRHRGSWWESAGAILQAPGCGREAVRKRFQIGVTPAILNVRLSRALLAHLEGESVAAAAGAKGGDGGKPASFDRVMFGFLGGRGTSDWTEYTMYWAFGCKLGVLDALHYMDPKQRVYDTSAFGWRSFDSYNADRVFADQSTFFGVVQSINGATPAQVIEKLGSRL